MDLESGYLPQLSQLSELNVENVSLSNVKFKKQKKLVWITIFVTIVLTLNVSLDIVSVKSMNSWMVNHNSSHSLSSNFTNFTTDVRQVTQKIIENDEMVLCSFFKQFTLSSTKRLTLCRHNNKLRIDFRYFVNNVASSKGIYLSRAEWQVFVMLFGKIQSTIVNN